MKILIFSRISISLENQERILLAPRTARTKHSFDYFRGFLSLSLWTLFSNYIVVTHSLYFSLLTLY